MILENSRRLFQGLAPDHMIDQGIKIANEFSESTVTLLEQRRLPERGLSEDAIEKFLSELALMDSDKDPVAARIGEREARVSCKLVSRLSFGFNHGIGRSGNILAPQPKAVGASCMYNLANRIALDSLRRFGAPKTNGAILLPLATGMSIGLALSACRDLNGSSKNEVVVARCDHVSPMKAIATFGMKARVVDGEVDGDAVKVPLEKLRKATNEKTAAILTTTTFFPPREPDDISRIAKIAKELEIPHIVNNAYGVQSRKIMKLIDEAMNAGRVDAFVQSTDKNFLTSIGGSIVASSQPDFIEKIGEQYAGRATAVPALQFLSSMLFLAVSGYEGLRDDQERNRASLEEGVRAVAASQGERVLDAYNPVTVAMTLTSRKNPKRAGYKLYSLRVTGPRVVEPLDFGTCCPNYPSPYITMNAAIGCERKDIELALERLKKALKE